MRERSRTELRNISIAVAAVLQMALLCYFVFTTLGPQKSKQDEPPLTNEQSSELSELDGIHSAYRTILLNNKFIASTFWEVEPEFFRYLLQRKKQDVNRFEGGHATNDGVIKLLKKFPIHDLRLTNTQVTPACLNDIASIDCLDQLEIVGLNLTSDDLKIIVKLKHLTSLRADNCGLTDECLKVLSTHKFKWLALNGNPKVTDAGVTYLASQPLTTLALGSTSITDRIAPLLEPMSSLVSLVLPGDRITDRSLPYFARIKNLDSLNLCGTLITDQGLQEFKPTRLKVLLVHKCNGLTKSGINEFRKRNPDCALK